MKLIYLSEYMNIPVMHRLNLRRRKWLEENIH